MIEIITAIATLESFGYHFNNWAEPLMIDDCRFRNHKVCRNNRKLLHVVCETIRGKKLLKLSKLYNVNHVEG